MPIAIGKEGLANLTPLPIAIGKEGLIYPDNKPQTMKYAEIKEFARKLRRNQTPSEERLWHFIRKKQLKNKQFLRQHPIIYDRSYNNFFCYIPDFYCQECKLAVELDGKIHLQQKERDSNRDAILEGMGITVLRFDNEELHHIKIVLKTIEEHLE